MLSFGKIYGNIVAEIKDISKTFQKVQLPLPLYQAPAPQPQQLSLPLCQPPAPLQLPYLLNYFTFDSKFDLF